ncbi:MAG: hypothetical protein ABS81_05660 [Pseudonocardia sp. SCN 72-86]|nr:MAG: hypothetical protein ABS81_05660 [Pseudonocardia sp. SCN 72-86]
MPGKVLVCDGAMGTMLHAAGVALGQPLSALNTGRPSLVRDLHTAYLSAGANLIQTNTFDANRLKLADIGQGERVAEVNIAGARLAREAAQACGRSAFVAGSVGPVRGTARHRVARDDQAEMLREQIVALADWVDLLVLETFGEISAMAQAIEIALEACDLPIVAELTFERDGRTPRGEEPAEVAVALASYEVAAIGANCTVGPAVLQGVVAQMAGAVDLPIVVQPNAGAPQRLGDELRYAHNTKYFAGAAAELVAKGAAIVGGCCGTTPSHIRAITAAVRGLSPIREDRRAGARPSPARPYRPRESIASAPQVRWPTGDTPVIIAGLPLSRGPEVAEYVDAARAAAVAGAGLVAVIDADRQAPTVNPVSAAVLLNQRVGVDVLHQVEGAGRSMAALQADLLGAHAFGLRTVICRTGEVLQAGDYPQVASADEVDSTRLVGILAGLNDGVDWRGVPLPERTSFVIGALIDVTTADLNREVEKVAVKVETGAHFLLSDVVYEESGARNVLSALRLRGVEVPVLFALAPFHDAQIIARLTHEAPGARTSQTLGTTPPRDVVASALGLASALLADGAAGILVHGPASVDDRMTSIIKGLRDLCQGVK